MSTSNFIIFDNGIFTFDGLPFGVTELKIGKEIIETEISTTETSKGEIEILFGRKKRSISFTAYRKVGSQSLPTKMKKNFSFAVYGGMQILNMFVGQCILGSKKLTGSKDGVIQEFYTGRIEIYQEVGPLAFLTLQAFLGNLSGTVINPLSNFTVSITVT